MTASRQIGNIEQVIVLDQKQDVQSSQLVQRVPLKFQIGARTLFSVQRAMIRVPFSLEDARLGALPPLPPLPKGAHGYSITSLPQGFRAVLAQQAPGMRAFVGQSYTRYYADFTIGFDAWWNALSSNTRQSVRRKARKIASENGGDLDVRRFQTAAELEHFHDVARRISLRTYQERLLGSGLPDTPEFLREMAESARAGKVRAWLLYIAGEPAAYLYCPIIGQTVIYSHVGHDPAFNDFSPGVVLQMEAFRDLFEEQRFACFDFTEGEGQHKRQFASGGVECVDLLLLRSSIGNRAVMALLGAFNASVALAKRIVQQLGLTPLTRKLRRG